MVRGRRLFLLLEEPVLPARVGEREVGVPEAGGPAVGIALGPEFGDYVVDLLSNGAEVEEGAPVLELLGFLKRDGVVLVPVSECAIDE